MVTCVDNCVDKAILHYFGNNLNSDLIFGGTALVSAHFDSDVAKVVFNDANDLRRPSALRQVAERRTLAWLRASSPKTIMQWSRQIDLLVVPVLSPSGFRQFCAILCEELPQAIENMPHTKESVTALARAVHLSKFVNSSALGRIHDALATEGLI